MKSLREEIKKMLVSEFNIQWGNPESIDKFLALFESAVNEIIGSVMLEVDDKYKSFTLDEFTGIVLEIQRRKLKEMIGGD